MLTLLLSTTFVTKVLATTSLGLKNTMTNQDANNVSYSISETELYDLRKHIDSVLRLIEIVDKEIFHSIIGERNDLLDFIYNLKKECDKLSFRFFGRNKISTNPIYASVKIEQLAECCIMSIIQEPFIYSSSQISDLRWIIGPNYMKNFKKVILELQKEIDSQDDENMCERLQKQLDDSLNRILSKTMQIGNRSYGKDASTITNSKEKKVVSYDFTLDNEDLQNDPPKEENPSSETNSIQIQEQASPQDEQQENMGALTIIHDNFDSTENEQLIVLPDDFFDNSVYFRTDISTPWKLNDIVIAKGSNSFSSCIEFMMTRNYFDRTPYNQQAFVLLMTGRSISKNFKYSDKIILNNQAAINAICYFVCSLCEKPNYGKIYEYFYSHISKKSLGKKYAENAEKDIKATIKNLYDINK